jgi:hypothetical protein
MPASRKPSLPLPTDLKKALAGHRAARAAWARQAPSHRREYILSIVQAKQPETRRRRIRKALERLAESGGSSKPLARPSTKPLAAKLGLKAGQRLHAYDAPTGYADLLGPLPRQSRVLTSGAGPFEMVHLFARDRASLECFFPAALEALRPDGILWISYPKAGALGTDLTRDRGWAVVQDAGYEAVLQVAVNETWSALRFKLRATQ